MSIETRLRRIEQAYLDRLRATPPDPVKASVSERLLLAMVLAGFRDADGIGAADFRTTFFECVAKLQLIVPDSLREAVWRRANTLQWKAQRDPDYVRRLQVPPEVRARPIRLRYTSSAGGATTSTPPETLS